MSLYFLTQTMLNADGATSNATGGTTASGYSLNDLIAGPRSTFWRSAAATGAIGAGYAVAADHIISHIVVARADRLLTSGTMRVRPIQRNSSATWSYITGFDFNPLTSADLLGPTSQDLVMAVSPTVYRGAGIEADTISATAEACEISKVFCSSALLFDVEPDLSPAPRWQLLESSPTPPKLFPLRGFQPYAVERSLTITWTGISIANYEAFLALPRIFEWPLYLYDSAGSIWSWKLEHVIVTDYSAEILSNDDIRLSVTFARLKHYV